MWEPALSEGPVANSLAMALNAQICMGVQKKKKKKKKQKESHSPQ